MPSLKLENHVFRLLENEQTALTFLNRTAHSWVWELDLPGGEILFREPGTGRILFSSSIKLIGTYDQQSGKFQFGWFDPTIPEDWKCVTGLAKMRVVARGAGLEIFDSPEPITLSTPTQAESWAIASAGYLEAFSLFEARQAGKTQYVVVESFPDSGLIQRDIHTAQNIIEEGVLQFSLNHRQAVEAYLGSPSAAGGSNLADETLYWHFGDNRLRIQFAHHGQIISMTTEIPQPVVELVELPQEAESKPSFLGRLFGKRR